jgi:NADPH:quinone reductase-like Zn-dependent oxidoreductase
MKAAQINSYGGQDVLTINKDASKPSASEGQVLVEVSAAGLNPFDVKVREGFVRQMVELHFPATLGGDLAGIVTEVGPGVSGFEIGQKVYGQAGALSGQGSLAEYAPVKADSLSLAPTSIDLVTAAALPLASVSAYQALVTHINLLAGQKVLIHGGAGGIGSIAIQLAKNIGAYVATTVSSSDIEYVKEIGADEALDYKNQDFTAILQDYDAVFDTVGGETTTKSYQVLKQGGSLVSMVDKADDKLVKQYGISYTHQYTQVNTDSLNSIARLVDEGVLKVNIDKVFPLDQAAEALEYLKTSHPRGKVVVRIKT